MQIIPLDNVPSQTFAIVLNGQNCNISVYQLETGVYLDLALDGVSICNSRLCVAGVAIVRNAASGFGGELYFIDTTGSQNPDYLGMGTTYQLVYIP